MERQSEAQGQNEAVVRVFHDGMGAEGMEVTMAELESMLADGRLSRHDLIFADGKWKPLDAVYDLPETPEESSGEGAGDELAMRLLELPSLFAVGGAPLPGGASATGTASKGKGAWLWVVLVLAAVVIVIVALCLLR